MQRRIRAKWPKCFSAGGELARRMPLLAAGERARQAKSDSGKAPGSASARSAM